MKIKTWIKYEEGYLPPRCRKMRYRECEDYINVNLKEVEKDELRLAFEDKSYSGKGEIYLYNGKLYCKEKMPNMSIIEDLNERGNNINTPLDYLIWCSEHCSTYFFFHWDRERGENTSRDAVIRKARNDIKKYILVDGELYVQSAEPRYCIYTFGLGHNHGGTALSVNYGYNPNISKDCYFSALDGEIAVAEANETAKRRGDTNNVGKFEAKIVVHMPELVKVKPKKQHGDGNKFLNSIEQVISNSDSALEAGLLAIAMCGSGK